MTERADQLHYDNEPAHSTALVQTFWAKHHITQFCQSPLHPRFGSLPLLVFPKPKIAFEKEEICECDGHTIHKLSQRRLTADRLAPCECDCSWIHSKVSSDGLQSYMKATRPVLEILKMFGYFLDSPLKFRNIWFWYSSQCHKSEINLNTHKLEGEIIRS